MFLPRPRDWWRVEMSFKSLIRGWSRFFSAFFELSYSLSFFRLADNCLNHLEKRPDFVVRQFTIPINQSSCLNPSESKRRFDIINQHRDEGLAIFAFLCFGDHPI